ncbi:MAG: hypothetical protein PF485_08300 [Bacteroidales bacterium]|jgi:UDP-N-acetylmuramyl pentapeptide phosphotransferase/UDP-N-acetylglucosamine-1-phosphate transferase|nr:hypothetical protein [Bacteroidales bacterium]
MKDFITKHKFGFILIVPGIIAGYLYWKYVGCMSGTCAIQSNWHTMILFGGLIGYFLGDSIDDIVKKRKTKKEKDEQSTVD